MTQSDIQKYNTLKDLIFEIGTDRNHSFEKYWRYKLESLYPNITPKDIDAIRKYRKSSKHLEKTVDFVYDNLKDVA